MKIVGVTCHYTGNHDNSAALLVDGELVFAESEERITRIKHDRRLPVRAIEHALKSQNLKPSQVDYYVSASPPTNNIKLLLHSINGFHHTSFIDVSRWLIERSISFLLSKRNAQTEPDRKLPGNKLRFVSHYLAHAETAYSFSGMNDCLVVAWDGYVIEESGLPLCGSVYLCEAG